MTLAGLPEADRAVRVTWPGPLTPGVERRARQILNDLRLGRQTEVVLLSPVRLSGRVVRPAAISPLTRWADHASPGPCQTAGCPMLSAGGTVAPATLQAAGIRLRVIGATHLRSDTPLGFTPQSGETPVVLTGDVVGLATLPGLSSFYRTHSWFALAPTQLLHAWNLGSTERRLQDAQAALQASASQFTLAAPFAGLDAARASADAAPKRLLLTGGGALAALILFVVLAAGSRRRDQDDELIRLRGAGAQTHQVVVFALAEAGLTCLCGIVIGASVALGAGAILAHVGGSPAGGVLAHSLLTPTALLVAIAGLLLAAALLATLTLAHDLRIVDGLALAAAAALALALGRTGSGTDPLPVLLAPLACLVAGVIVFRLAHLLLRGAERLIRRGPVLMRVALVGLARAPGAPALAIAFIAVSTGLGGFALAYRATLHRAASDEAAAEVPLDAIVASGPSFTRPLELAPLGRWQSLARGPVAPVRRTDASFPDGAQTATVPALGLPASTLTLLRGLGGAGSVSIGALARRLNPPGPARTPGPVLPTGAHTLTLTVRSPRLDLDVAAALRDPQGDVRQVALGTAGPDESALRARLPPGRWELEAFVLSESSGLAATNGHQNGENLAAATQSVVPVRLGPARALTGPGNFGTAIGLSGWRGAGAAATSPGASAVVAFGFTTSGQPGVVRPAQPTDTTPLPVLTDPSTARAAGPGGRLPLVIDGEPVTGHVIGTLSRFPTLEGTGNGFVVADEGRLTGALDGQLPGQGRSDELWIGAHDLAPLRAALDSGTLSRLTATYRSDIEHRLRTAPIARAVQGTLVAAAALGLALAVLGLLLSLLGPSRDVRTERDLVSVGVGPRGLRRELRLRMLVAAASGVVAGLVLAAALTRLAVSAVRAAGLIADPQPPVAAVAPWGELVAWALIALATLAVASWAATRSTVGAERLAG